MIDGNKQTTTVEYNVPPMEEIPNADNSRMASSMAPPEGYMGYDHPGDPKGKDDIPAWLSAGEAVIPKEAVDKFPQEVDRLIQAGRSIQDGQQAVYASDGYYGGNQYQPQVWDDSDESKQRRRNAEAMVDDNFMDAIMQVESGGDHIVPFWKSPLGWLQGDLHESPTGAKGAYQLLQSTAKDPGAGFMQSNPELFTIPKLEDASEEEHRRFAREYLISIVMRYPWLTRDELIRSFNAGPFSALKTHGKLNVPQGSSNFPYGVGFGDEQRVIENTRLRNADGELLEDPEYTDKVLAAMSAPIPAPPKADEEFDPSSWKSILSQPKLIPTISDPAGLTQAPNLDEAAIEAIKNSPELYDKDPTIAAYLFKKVGEKIGNSASAVYDFSQNPHDYVADWFQHLIPESTYKALKSVRNAEKLMAKGEMFPGLTTPQILWGHVQKAILESMVKDMEEGKIPHNENTVKKLEEVTNENKKNTEDHDASLTRFKDLLEKDIPPPPEEKVIPEVDFASVLNLLNENTDSKGVVDKEKVEDKIKEEEDNRGFWEKARDKMFEVLGNALDEEALAKMAINYGGSRLVGYDHSTSLNFAAKEYNVYSKQKQKQVDKWILDNADKYKPKSLEKFRRTHDVTDLEPIGAVFDSKGLGGSLFDNETGDKIELIKATNNVEYASLNLDGTTKNWTVSELLKTFPNRFSKWSDNVHDNLKITDRFTETAQKAISQVNAAIDDDNDLNKTTPLSQDIANTATQILRKYQSKYNLSANQSTGLMQKINRAIWNFYKWKSDFQNDKIKTDVHSLEGLLQKQFITPETKGILKFSDYKNTNDLNLTLLNSKIFKITDPFNQITDLEEHRKKVNNFYLEHKILWGAAGKRKLSYAGTGLVEEGWDPKIRWMYDLVTTDPSGQAVTSTIEALQLIYTTDSINDYIEAMRTNPEDSKNEELLVPVSDDMKKALTQIDKKIYNK